VPLTYYIADNGDDLLNGTSELTAWQTAAKYNASSFVGGDWIRFKAAATYKNLVLPSSGTSMAEASRVNHGRYGVGIDPIFTTRNIHLGSGTTGNWTETAPGSNIWWINNGAVLHPRRVWLDGAEAKHPNLPVNITATLRWAWESSTSRLYIYSVGNPTTFYSTIESLQNGFIGHTLHIVGKAFWYFERMDFRGGTSTSIMCESTSGVAARDGLFYLCKIGRDGRTGIYHFGHTGSQTECERIKVSFCEIESGYVRTGYTAQSDSAVNDGVTYDGALDCELSDSTVANYGHSGVSGYGRAGQCVSNNIKILRTIFSGPNSAYMRGIGCLGAEGTCSGWEIADCEMKDLTVGDQIWGQSHKYHHIRHYRKRNSTASATATAYGVGLYATDGTGGVIPSVSHDTLIAHVSFYDLDEPAVWFQAPVVWTTYGHRIINCVAVKCGVSSRVGFTNIAFAVSSSALIGDSDVKHNCFYNQGVTNVVSHHGTAMDVAALNALLTTAASQVGTDRIFGNIQQDPLYINPIAGDLSIPLASPAVNAGIVIADLTVFYAGAAPDMGYREAVGPFDKIAIYRNDLKVGTVPRTAAASAVQRISGAAAGMTGLTPSATYTWKFKGETNTGIESTNFSPALVATQPGGITLDAPFISVSEYDTISQGVYIQVTPGANHPPGTVYHVEHGQGVGGTNPTGEAFSGVAGFHSHGQNPTVSQTDYVNVFSRAPNWEDSGPSNEVAVFIPNSSGGPDQ
jgi:hypothetical protein